MTQQLKQMEQGAAGIETEPSSKDDDGASVSLLHKLLQKFDDLRKNQDQMFNE